MPSYIPLTTTRTTPPDPVALISAIRSATGDPTAVIVQTMQGEWRGKKATDWTPADTANAQNILDTVAPLTPQLVAQRNVDTFPIEYKALVLALVDQINVLRSKLTPPLPDITPAQAIAAIRQKAGTL